MSWDVSLAKEDQEDIEVANYTYNVSPMYLKAMGLTPSDLHDKMASDVIELLDNGIVEMIKKPTEYIILNPSNGWGNYEGAIEFLMKIAIQCSINPDWTIKVN